MDRLLLALVLGVFAVAVAVVAQRRRTGAPAQGSHWTVPAQLDRNDFDRAAAPWLVAVFTSATCDVCASVWQRAAVLDSAEVVVQQLEAKADRAVHERYRIDAVPLVVLADAEGVVRRHFLGPVNGADLWGAVAELREPGSVPPGCDAHG